MSEVTGRGWAKLENKSLQGLIMIHLSNELGFEAIARYCLDRMH